MPCRSRRDRQLDGPPSTASLFEFAPEGACLAAGHPAVARGLLPHGFTLTCAIDRSRPPSAVSFLLRFPSGRPGSALSTSLPSGARTFLPRTMMSASDPPSTSSRTEPKNAPDERQRLLPPQGGTSRQFRGSVVPFCLVDEYSFDSRGVLIGYEDGSDLRPFQQFPGP